MKIRFTIFVAITLFLGACSSSTYLADDAYYSPKDDARAAKKAVKEQAKATAIAAEQGLEAVQYTDPEGTIVGVSYGDTLTLDDFEYENGDKELVVNNYYENNYADPANSYETRINRFYGSSVGFGYYSPYYSPYYSSWGPSLSMSIGFGMGFGMGFGYGMGGYYPPYYPYYPPYYGGCYTCYPYYGGGGYYGGGPVYDDSGNGYYSSHRRSSSTARALNPDYIRAKSGDFYTPTTSSAGRSGRRGGTAIASTKSASTVSSTTQTPVSRRTVSSPAARSQEGIKTTRVIPNSSRSAANSSYRRTGQATRTNASASGNRTIPYKASSSNKPAVVNNRTQTGKSTANTSTKRYIPRYSTPKSNTNPSYNRSSTKARVTNSSSSVKRQGYSTPSRTKSTYSSPTRSSSTRSSYNRSSSGMSGSGSRSSGTVSRSSSSGVSSGSSSSGSRSSGSSGRRR